MKTIYIIFCLLIFTTGKENAFAQQNFETAYPAQMQQELSVIKKTLISLHPGIYRYETPAEVESLFKHYETLLSKPMRVDKYYILLSKLLTNVKCGHTYLNQWNQSREVRKQLFSKSFMPFLYRIIDNKMIVTHNLSDKNDIKAGDEIVSINGLTVTSIIDSMLTVSRADGMNNLGKKLNNINIEPRDIDTANYTLFDTYFPLLFPENFNTPAYRVKIKPFRNPAFLAEVKGMTKKERELAFINKFGKIPARETNWSLKFIDQQTACLRIGDFETWRWKTDYKKYLDSVFNLLEKKNIKNLVVDVRGNEGGDDEARDILFSYLTSEPFGCNDKLQLLYRFLTIPDSLSAYLTTWDQSFKKPKNTADFTELPGGLYEKKQIKSETCTPALPRANRFKGKKFLITDATNSSATFIMADMFQHYHAGKIIGEPTGGNKQGLNGGRLLFLTLPFSKIEIDIPIIWQRPSETMPDGGVQPDKVIKTTQADIHFNRDPQINYILSKTRK